MYVGGGGGGGGGIRNHSLTFFELKKISWLYPIY